MSTYCSNHDIEFIFNVPSSPDLNPIETMFAGCKDRFRRNKTACIVNKLSHSNAELITQAFNGVKIDAIRNSIRRSTDLMRVWPTREIMN